MSRTFTAPQDGPVLLDITSHHGQVRVTAGPLCKVATLEVRATTNDPALLAAVDAAVLRWDEARGAVVVSVPGLPGNSVHVSGGSSISIGRAGGSVTISGGNHGVIVTGNNVTISGGRVSGGTNVSLGEIEIIATVPPRSSIRHRGDYATLTTDGEFDKVAAQSASGNVNVSATQALDVQTASGDISAEAIDVTATLNSASGDIRIGRTGQITRAKTASGDIRIGDFGGTAHLDTASGDIAVHATEGGTITAKSMSGDVRISGTQEAQAAGLAVTATSMTGRTSVPQPLNAPTGRRPRTGGAA